MNDNYKSMAWSFWGTVAVRTGVKIDAEHRRAALLMALPWDRLAGALRTREPPLAEPVSVDVVTSEQAIEALALYRCVRRRSRDIAFEVEKYRL